MKYGDLTQQLQEYNKLTDDLTARLNFEPPPPIVLVCRQCGSTRQFIMTWDDVAQALRRGKAEEDYTLYSNACEKCEPDTEDEG